MRPYVPTWWEDIAEFTWKDTDVFMSHLLGEMCEGGVFTAQEREDKRKHTVPGSDPTEVEMDLLSGGFLLMLSVGDLVLDISG